MRPLVRCWLEISANRSHTTMLCHSVFSVRSPEVLSIHPSSVAIENRQKGVPLAVYFISGSRPRRPTRITLLTDFPIVQISTRPIHACRVQQEQEPVSIPQVS